MSDGTPTETVREYLPMLLVAAVVTGAGLYLRLRWGEPILGIPFTVFMTYFVSFLVGTMFIPLVAFTVGPLLPGELTEAIAGSLFSVTMTAVPAAVLKQLETDDYVLNQADPDLRPESYWSRWAGTAFGVTFEATRHAFGNAVATEEQRSEIENLEYVGGDRTASIEMSRAGYTSYAHEDDKDADILVSIGRKLSEFSESAGPEVIAETHSESLKEHGGDTSDWSNKQLIFGSAIFTFMGLLMGWVVFF